MKITVHDTLLPATYRKKPVVIQAMVWTGDNFSDIKKWAGDNVSLDGDELVIVTLEDGSKGQAKHVATVGDYIIQGVKGEFYFCKPDIFADTQGKVQVLCNEKVINK